MVAKKSSKTSSESVRDSTVAQPTPAHWKQANDALALYKKGKRDKAIKELNALLNSNPSGAACLARTKICVWQAIEDGMKASNATAREQAMLPHLHEALRLAVDGGTEHRSIHCTRLAAVLAAATSGRGGAAGELERKPHLFRLKQFVEGLEDGGRRESAWAPVAWEDVRNDRWPLEHAYSPHGRPPPPVSTFIREAVQHIRECLEAAYVQEIYMTAMASTVKDFVTLGPSGPFDAHKRQQVMPADRRLVESGMMRLEDANALKGRYEEERRQRAQRSASLAPTGGGAGALAGAPESQLGERKGSGRLKSGGTEEAGAKLSSKRAEIEKKRIGREYVAAKTRAAKVVEFLEKEVLGGLSDEELRQHGVGRLTEVPLPELAQALAEQLPQHEARDVMGNLQRAQAGVPIHYRWPESEDSLPHAEPAATAAEGSTAAGNAAAGNATAGNAASAAGEALAGQSEYTDAQEFERELRRRLLRAPLPDLALETVKAHVKGWRELAPKGALTEEVLHCLVCGDKSLLPDSIHATLAPGDAEAFLDRSGAVQQALQQLPSTSGAHGAHSGASEGGPAASLCGGVTATVDQQGEQSADFCHLRKMHSVVGQTDPGGTFAARDKLGPVAWLEANRSLRDRSKALLGALDGSNLVDQEQVQALVKYKEGPMTAGAMRGALQLSKDLAALRRWLVGSELMALVQAQAGAQEGAGAMELARLRRAQEVLRMAPSEEDIARLLEVVEPDAAVRAQLLQVASHCLKGLRGPLPKAAAQQAQQRPQQALANGLAHAASEGPSGEENEFVGDSEEGNAAAAGSQEEKHAAPRVPRGPTHALREPGFSPIEDAALLGLLRLPWPEAGAGAAQGAEQVLQVKQEVAEGVLGALRHLQSRGRLYEGTVTAIAMFVWSTHRNEQAQHEKQAQQGEAQRAQREFEFAELYWKRLPRAARAQLVRMGELPLLSLLQLQAYLAQLYAESFWEVGDLCPQFQVQLYRDGSRVEVDSARGVVRLTSSWLGELVQKKREAEQGNGPIEGKKTKKAPAIASSSSAAGESEGSGIHAVPAANPRAAAAASLQALAEHGYGATSALKRVRSQQVLAANEEDEDESSSKFAQRQSRVRRLLGLLGLLCPMLGSARSMVAGLAELQERMAAMLARIEQGDAALLEELDVSWLTGQAEAFTAFAGEAIKAHTCMETTAAALEFKGQSSTADHLQLLKCRYGGACAKRIQEAADYHKNIRGACHAVLAVSSLHQPDNQPAAAAVQNRDSTRAALSLLRQGAALWEAASEGENSVEALAVLPSSALAPAFRSMVQAAKELAPQLDLALLRTAGLLEATHAAATALMGELVTHHCCLVCLDSVAGALLNHVLPTRWERQMEAARGRGDGVPSEADLEAELLAMDQRKAAAEAAKAERKREKKRAKKAERRAADQGSSATAQQEQQQEHAQQGGSPNSSTAAAAPDPSVQQAPPTATQKSGCAQMVAQFGESCPSSPVAVMEGTPSEPSPDPAEALGPASPAEAAAAEAAAGGAAAEGAVEDGAGGEGRGAGGATADADLADPAVNTTQQAEAAAQPAGNGNDNDSDGGWEQAPSQRRRQAKHRDVQERVQEEEEAPLQQQREPPRPRSPVAAGGSDRNGNSSSGSGNGSQNAAAAAAAGAGAPPAKEHSADAPADAQGEDQGWQEAGSHRRRQQVRPGTAGAAGSAAARHYPPGMRNPARRVEARGQEVMRIITWKGDWQCPCGRKCWPRQHCKFCEQYSPCRNWVFLGGCERLDCKFPHPPFDLPAEKPPVGPDGKSLEKGPDGKPYDIVKPHSKVHPSVAAAAARSDHARPQSAGHLAAAPGSSWGLHGQAAIARPTSPLSPHRGRPAASASTAAAAAQPPSSPPVPVPAATAVAAAAQPVPAAAPAAGPSGAASSASGASHASQQRPQTAPARLAPSHAALPPPAAPVAAAAAPPAQPQPPPTEAAPPRPSPSKKLNPNAVPWNGTFSATIPTISSSSSSLSSGSSSNAVPVAQPGATGAWSAEAMQQRAQQPAQHAQQPLPAQPAAQAAAKQEKEDTELALLLEASLSDTQQAAAAAAAPATSTPAGSAPTAEGAGVEASDLAAPTLSNEAGEYNCFLNAVLQCLWYCREFRQQVAGWPAEFYSADPVVNALRDLFAAFAEKEKAGRNGSGGGGHVINPAPLREALSALRKDEFRMGEMSDASELLLTIYEHIRQLAAQRGQRGRPSASDAVFGLAVREGVQCGRCRRTTHQSNYTQYLYTTQATAVRMQLMVMAAEGQPAPSMGCLLREIEEQALKSCDTDAGGCGELNPITHVLERPPRVFTLQLAWESHRESGADIAATLAGVHEQIDLCELYRGLPGQHVYRLRSMVCYYGAHYQAFVLVPELGRWLIFDDTRVCNIGGSFKDVRQKCEAGRIQPSAFFYESAN